MPLRNDLIKTSLRATVTESAANTFTEQQIDTNLSIRGDHIFIVTGVFWQHNAVLNGTGDQIAMQLTYATQSGLITASDNDFLFGIHQAHEVATQGAATYLKSIWMPMDEFPVAVTALFLGVQGVSLASAVQASVKIHGYHVKVNTTEYFRLAQSR